MPMKFRTFGSTGLKVSEVGFGAWAIGGGLWGKSDDLTSLNALRRALELGVNFIDTAPVYGRGHSEQLVGRVHRERSEKFYVATKVPPKDWKSPPAKDFRVSDAFPADWIREQTEKSLKNLRLETVDFQQLHVWSPNWVKETEWLEALRKLKEEGKIRFIGVSINDRAPQEALELAKSGLVDVLQVVFNIFEQAPADQLLELCYQNHVGVIARVPLDEGSLTGKYTEFTKFPEDDWRAKYFANERLKETLNRVQAIKIPLTQEASSMTVGALKFCLSHPAVSTVIPGIRTLQQASINCSVSNAPDLSQKLLQELKKHRWDR